MKRPLSEPCIHIVGDGVVARRLHRLLARRDLVAHSSRRVSTADMASGDVVILACGGHHTPVAEAIVGGGGHVISMSDADVGCLIGLGSLADQQDVTLVVGAATSPGLSGLIARHVADGFEHLDEIHVALHGTAGPECARVHHRSLSGRAVAWHNGGWREYVGGSGRELVWFPEPIGALDSYRAKSPEPQLLQRAFPEVVRISHRRTARRRDRLTARLPMLRPPHAEGAIGGLRIELRGAATDGSRLTTVHGVAEMIGTAAAASAAAFAAELITGGLPAGVVIPGDSRLPTVRLLRHIGRSGIRLQEFTGIPQPGGIAS